MSIFPTGVVSLPTWQDEIDVVSASIVNTFRDEIIAMQTYIGTNPQGSKSTLTERMSLLIDTNGAIFTTSGGFPANTFEGRLVWRPDQITAYIYGNSAWNALGQSLSNTVFSFSASGTTNGTALPKWDTGSTNGAYNTCILSRFKKIAGISSVRAEGCLWSSAGVVLRVTIGSVVGTVLVTSTTPTIGSITMDVSGLTNGTTVNLVAELFSSNHSGGSFMNSLIGIAS